MSRGALQRVRAVFAAAEPFCVHDRANASLGLARFDLTRPEHVARIDGGRTWANLVWALVVSARLRAGPMCDEDRENLCAYGVGQAILRELVRGAP